MGRSERAILAATAAFGTLITGGCAPPRPTVPFARLQPAEITTVRPGDVISIEFWGQLDLTGERIVDNDGRIQLPILKSVEVAGLSAEEIRVRLTEAYRQYYADPLIVVNVRLGVNVTGKVVRSGRYTVDPAFTILDLIGLAGGLEDDAKRDGLELNRGGERYKINLNEAQLSTEADRLRLQSGDWLYVPRRFWTLQRTFTYVSIMVLGITIANFFVN